MTDSADVTARIMAGLALATLCACSAPTSTTPAGPASLAPQAKALAGRPFASTKRRAEFYVANYTVGSVAAYAAPDRKDRPPLCAIGKGVRSVNWLGVDKDGTVWIPQSTSGPSGSGAVTSYAARCGAQGLTLLPPSGVPSGATPGAIAFDGGGNIYLNWIGIEPLNVYVYPYRSDAPTSELQAPFVSSSARGVGIDAQGNVYASYPQSSKGTGVAVFKAGRMPATSFLLQGLVSAGGSILFDHHDNMLVPDYGSSTLNVFAPPYTGAPRVLTLKAAPWQCSLNRRETDFACTASNHNPGSIDFYSYPAGAYHYSVTSGISGAVFGMAFDPTARN